VRPVSNTTPLIHLARVGLLDLLGSLYTRVDAPPAVMREAERHIGGTVAAAERAGWLVEVVVADGQRADQFERVLGGRGEAETIALAIETPDAMLLVDEHAARQFARAQGIALRGPLGVLLDAKRLGRLGAVRPHVDHLRATGFWLDDRTYATVLELAGE